MYKYYAATKKDLENETFSIKYKFHIKYLLRHNGFLRIEDDGINLENFRFINYDDIIDVDIRNDKLLSSWKVGNQNRLLFLKSSKPIIIKLKDETIYLYVNWQFLTGLSDNKKILEIIKSKVKER
ncbi:MAG: hypothetical protein Q4B52_04960 [Tissierellia bacterium]|nr:hypothetical protein [Tissierellia bacterium]